jgi:hypothetical protein
MRLPFSRRRTAELETKLLTDAARKRAERIKELEHQVAQFRASSGPIENSTRVYAQAHRV